MKEWFEFPQGLSTFYNEIYVQFDKHIKVLRSDNTLEYMASFVLIMALFSKPVGLSTQQNDVTEQKHWHLLDVARTLMFNMHVPKQYLADVILTTCYLINRMLSFLLNN